MSRFLEDRQSCFRGKVVPPENAPVTTPEAGANMGSDIPAKTCYHVMELLSDPLGPVWKATRQVIEQRNKEHWFLRALKQT